ncbi:hypothetical protein V2J56_11190 [Georgenia sp. MJ206]
MSVRPAASSTMTLRRQSARPMRAVRGTGAPLTSGARVQGAPGGPSPWTTQGTAVGTVATTAVDAEATRVADAEVRGAVDSMAGASRSPGAWATAGGAWATAGARSASSRLARWESGSVLSRIAVVGAALVLSAFVVVLALGAGLLATTMLDLVAPSR